MERSPYSTLKPDNNGYADFSGMTGLQIAVSRHSLKAVAEILACRGIFSNRSFEIDAQDDEGDTALIIATINSDWRILELLLSYGANPDIQNNRGKTALIKGAEVNARYEVKVLVKNHANLDIQDVRGNTALIYCIFHNKDYILEELIGGGADLDIQNSDGLTVLHVCVAISKRRNRDTSRHIKLLISNGANPNIRDVDGDIAEKLTNDPSVKECIKEAAREYAIRTWHESMWFGE